METAINKLQQWLLNELEISNELAHDVAQAEMVEDMVQAKSAYQIQQATTQAIGEAIRIVEEVKSREDDSN